MKIELCFETCVAGLHTPGEEIRDPPPETKRHPPPKDQQIVT